RGGGAGMRRLKACIWGFFGGGAGARSREKAATHFAFPHPAVSKAIAQMEHTLGVPLLDRTKQGVEPTLYGGALLKWAAAVFDDLRQGVREIEFLADPSGGEVRIGSTEIMNTGLLPFLIDRLSLQHPRLVFTVRLAPAISLQYHDLRGRHIDLIFGRTMLPIKDEDIQTEVFFDDHLVIVAGAGNKWLRRRDIDPAELIDEP